MRYIALLMGLLASPSYALTSRYFSAEVAINAENKQPEQVAFVNTGMEQVLIRATGQTDVASNETIQKAMRKSSQYMSQMSFGESNEANQRCVCVLTVLKSVLYWRKHSCHIGLTLVQISLFGWWKSRTTTRISCGNTPILVAAGLQANAKKRRFTPDFTSRWFWRYYRYCDLWSLG